MIISQYYAHITDEIAARSAAFRLSHASTGLVDLDAIHRRVVEIDLANARHGKIARIAGEDTRLAQAMPHGVKIRDPDGKVAGNGWIDGQLVVHGKCGDGLHDVKAAVAIAKQVVCFGAAFEHPRPCADGFWSRPV